MAAISLAGHPAIWSTGAGELDACAIIEDCACVLDAPGPLIISDTAGDPRFMRKRPGPETCAVRFYAGIPITSGEDTPSGTLSLMGAAPRRLTAEEERALQGMAGIAGAVIGRVRDAQVIETLRRDLDAQTCLAAQHHDSVLRYKKMYERSSALARIGTWECDLTTEQLTWTDGVYDIFELPRGSAITRQMILDLYFEESRKEMERLRSRAIAECSGFAMDIRIRTPKGNKRWVRLSVDVEAEEGRPVRIFGTKQDVTQEKELLDRMRRLAQHDPLTGLVNRSMFEEQLLESLVRAPAARALAALVLIDLDGFKAINDTFGHAAGDACLKATAKRLRGAFGKSCLIGRVGGDEFAVLCRGLKNRAGIEDAVRRAVAEIRKPIAWEGQEFDVGASVGICMPTDPGASNLTQVFADADAAMYAAKKAGRNRCEIAAPVTCEIVSGAAT
ncbi:diguanylate cyclase [Aquabacter sp. CN5-332]|uniref:diguanylate cyclase domain-containing protein n=1 Tax=Aquabacter sp. CN5-332 TaxID=3156608 RepID=UPI0032B5EE9B